jgi:hypothetical protein
VRRGGDRLLESSLEESAAALAISTLQDRHLAGPSANHPLR